MVCCCRRQLTKHQKSRCFCTSTLPTKPSGTTPEKQAARPSHAIPKWLAASVRTTQHDKQPLAQKGCSNSSTEISKQRDTAQNFAKAPFTVRHVATHNAVAAPRWVHLPICNRQGIRHNLPLIGHNKQTECDQGTASKNKKEAIRNSNTQL